MDVGHREVRRLFREKIGTVTWASVFRHGPSVVVAISARLGVPKAD